MEFFPHVVLLVNTYLLPQMLLRHCHTYEVFPDSVSSPQSSNLLLMWEATSVLFIFSVMALSLCNDFFPISFSFIRLELLENLSISVQSLSHVQLCDPMDCNTPDFPVYHCLQRFVQTHVHWVSDAIQSSHPLSAPSSLALSLSQHGTLFQWVDSSQQVIQSLPELGYFTIW